MEKLIREAVYSIPKLDLEQFCKINNTTVKKLYESIDFLEDSNLQQLFLNRYPQNIISAMRINGENVIKQILNIRHLKTKEIATTYGITKRWLFKIIKRVEKTNPELYNLYRKFRDKLFTQADEEKIKQMPIGSIQESKLKYNIPKNVMVKRTETDKMFKSKTDIEEEIFNKIADKCEDPEQLEEMLKDPDIMKIIENRWKKEKVLIKFFEDVCDKNRGIFAVQIQDPEVRKKFQEEFRKIDEEDKIAEILSQAYKEKEKEE